MTKETAYKIIEAAISAPSGDNLQPWQFFWDGEDTIAIHLDSVIDESLFNIVYKDKKLASLMAIGAAVENICISAEYFGYTVQITYFPDQKESNCCVKVKLCERRYENNDAYLYLYITSRCVNRKFSHGEKIEEDIQEKIIAESRHYPDFTLHWVDDRDVLKNMASIVAIADKIMFETEGLLLPLMRSIRWTKKEEEIKKDGMPINSLELGFFERRAFRLFLHWRLVQFLNLFGLSKTASARSGKLVQSSSALCLLTTGKEINLTDYIRTGQTFQRIWLRAVSLKLSLQPMAGIVFLLNRMSMLGGEGLSKSQCKKLEYLHNKVYRIFSLKTDETPLMLFRLFYSEQPSCKSIRKSVEDVLIKE